MMMMIYRRLFRLNNADEAINLNFALFWVMGNLVKMNKEKFNLFTFDFLPFLFHCA